MIASLLQMQWREPLWLGLAALPLLFLWWQRRRRARLLRYADADLLPWAVQQRPHAEGQRWRDLAHAVGWVLLALAAAGPRLPLELEDGQPVPRHRLTVMVVLDVSASMNATDVVPDRLVRARLELLDWLPRLQGERVGLIVFAGEAGLLLPPTDDVALVQRALEQVDPRLIEAQGTYLAAALDLARAQLGSPPAGAGAVLLVSDAEAGSVDEAAGAAAAALREAAIPLFVLAVGSEMGAPIPLPDGGYAENDDGSQATSRMRLDPFREWTQASGGRLALASDGDGDWVALHDQGIAALPGDPLPPESAAAWAERYPWFLAPALALFMVAGLPRRVSALALAAAFAAMLAPPSATADEAGAWAAWQGGDYARAQFLYAQLGGYGGHMGAGAAAWRQGTHAAAAGHFATALLLARDDRERADALYNLGNAHYGRGQWQAAWEAFGAVLEMRPGDERASFNRDRAWQRLKKQRSEAPMQSDLGGRRGFLAEGNIQLDGQTAAQPDDPELSASGMQVQRDPAAAGAARAQGDAAAGQGFAIDPRLAASGLKKLERLQDRPTSLLQNLLKQDARRDDTERPPW